MNRPSLDEKLEAEIYRMLSQVLPRMGTDSLETDASHIAFRSVEQRDREFADSPLEEGGFELVVPL